VGSVPLRARAKSGTCEIESVRCSPPQLALLSVSLLSREREREDSDHDCGFPLKGEMREQRHGNW